MGALIKITEVISYDDFLKNMEEELKKKFETRPEIVEGNMKAIKRAYREVNSE